MVLVKILIIVLVILNGICAYKAYKKKLYGAALINCVALGIGYYLFFI